jgi:hypothetical protein
MTALVIVESFYGNTRLIADAIAEGLAQADDVRVLTIAEAAADAALVGRADLLAVGGPTHIHGLASDRSRTGAGDGHPEVDVTGPTLRHWLDGLARGTGRHAIAFDTRLGKPRIITGSAARGIARHLEALDYTVLGTESFIVDHGEGPLREGEVARARAWGERTASATRVP